MYNLVGKLDQSAAFWTTLGLFLLLSVVHVVLWFVTDANQRYIYHDSNTRMRGYAFLCFQLRKYLQCEK